MKIGKYNIKDKLFNDYIGHLNMKAKGNLYDWELRRKKLHDNVFKSIKLDRHSDKGQEFGVSFDKYCEAFLENPLDRQFKRISACKDLKELNHEKKRMEFIKKWSNK